MVIRFVGYCDWQSRPPSVRCYLVPSGSEVRLFTIYRLRFSCLLREELSDYLPVILILNSCEEFLTQRFDCFRTVKWKSLIHHAAREMTRLAARLKDRFDLRREIYFRRAARPSALIDSRKRIDSWRRLKRSVIRRLAT